MLGPVDALPSARAQAPSSSPRILAGGIVAHNDELRIERSIRSLLEQQLPPATEWGKVWVVASGCTDRTVDIARSLKGEYPRLNVVEQPDRRGKAAAIREVLARAGGDSLVLLNSDAVAGPGAVAALLAKAAGKSIPYAVMGRPVVPSGPGNSWKGTMAWMWDLHHQLHVEMLADGQGAHLSDELLLVSLPPFPWIEEGVINDGSYCAVWLQQHAGGCWYAPEALVSIDVPTTPSEHLRQRRRIHVGNAQVNRRLGRRPTTAFRFFLHQPIAAARAFRHALQSPGGVRHLVQIVSWEAVSHLQAFWDRLPPERDHVLWTRIGSPVVPALPAAAQGRSAEPVAQLERRVRVLMNVAGQFGTQLPDAELLRLLPTTERPDLGDVRRTFVRESAPAGTTPVAAGEPESLDRLDVERTRRGDEYRRAAKELFEGPLAGVLPLVRCVGVTGSVAYGKPREGDDLDFFVVVRSGAVAAFLAATYASIRIEEFRLRRRADPTPCFNFVIDERDVVNEFREGRGLLFAREALTAQVIHGDAYYRGLLAQSPWMARELPRLYAERTARTGSTAHRPPSLMVRVAGALLSLPLAAFLQAIGLYRNHAARLAGRSDELFRTLTTPRRVAFQSERFERLRAAYDAAEIPPASVGAPVSRVNMRTAR